MKSNKYAFRDIKNAKDKKDFLEFLRYQTTAEYGGNQIFDGPTLSNDAGRKQKRVLRTTSPSFLFL